jgi:hypothetical protein
LYTKKHLLEARKQCWFECASSTTVNRVTCATTSTSIDNRNMGTLRNEATAHIVAGVMIAIHSTGDGG